MFIDGPRTNWEQDLGIRTTPTFILSKLRLLDLTMGMMLAAWGDVVPVICALIQQ